MKRDGQILLVRGPLSVLQQPSYSRLLLSVRLLWLIVLSIFCFDHLSAQQILFRNYTVKDGLGSNTVWDIQQDARGYMWFATKNGLNRFNGYEFTTYRYSRELQQGIGNNFIHSICNYDSTSFWLGTEAGIYILDLEKESFTKSDLAANDVVFSVIRDSKGTVWIATARNGVYNYNPATKKTNHFLHKPGNLQSVSLNSIRCLAEDDKGRIWIGTFGEGIDVYDPATGSFEHYKPAKEKQLADANRVMTIYKDLAGNIWAGTLGGLHQVEKNTGRFRSWYKGGDGSLNDNIVRAIYQPAAGKLYVGTEKGLNMLDVATGNFKAFTHQYNDPRSISDNAVYSIYPDRNGGIWIGTFFGGINYFPRESSGFGLHYATGEKNALSGNAVSCFLEDAPGKFYIGTENAGLNYFDEKTGIFSTYPFTATQQQLSYHNIHSLLKDRQNRIWIGTFSAGLNIFNPADGSVRKYEFNKDDSLSISSNNIYSLYQDKNDMIWIGTTRGLNRYDQKNDRFDRITEMGLGSNIIYSIYEDDNNTMWFITYDNGMVSMNRKTGKWIRYTSDGKPNSISSNKIISVYDDQEGNLWLGTDGYGLNRFNKEAKTFSVYDEQQGIPQIIFGILPDKDNKLWLSTNEGIVHFDRAGKVLRTYNNIDDLQSSQFNYNAALRASDGKLFFGGINGFNSFYPDSLVNRHVQSPVTLTNLQVLNKDVVVGTEAGPLSKSVSYAENIDLRYDQSVVSIEYAALNYLAPGKIQYAYMLEGFEKNWNYVGSQRKATYRNLPPGNYRFIVRATDMYGNWSDQRTAISISVHPPFYRTTVAYILYGILIFVGILIARNLLAERARKKNEARLEQMKVQREKEFYDQKMEFFTNMAHEIRTPLSLIIAPLERLISNDDWKPETREQLNLMDENADRLLNLVNQLLDFRRIESDIYTIHKEDLELIGFIHALYARFSTVSFQKGLKFLMLTNIHQLNVKADPEALTKILTNLLMNAFKFTKSRVEIRVNDIVAHDGLNHFSISVIDDGNGIPAMQLDNIFKAFFKINTEGQYNNIGGTGIGLALAKSLAEKHGGRLLVESREQQETVFTLLIPMENSEVKETREPSGEGIAFTETHTEDTDERTTVLVVEDDVALLGFICKSLRTENFRTISATNGEQGLQLLEQNNVDLVISDLMMPGMDGIAFCRHVKTNLSFSHIPFMLLTAKGNSESEIAGVENGADAYLVKPFKWKHLLAVCRNLVESRAILKEKFSSYPMAEPASLTSNKQDKEFIEKLVYIIESRLMDPQLSVELLSSEMSMSRSSLHKKIKGNVGPGAK